MMQKKKERKIQTLIFDNELYCTKRKIRHFIKCNNYKILKYKRDPIRRYKKEFRVRQREPCKFNKKTFRNIKIKKGVTAITGYLK